MFKELFRLLEERVRGFKAVVVVSGDGIEIESKIKSAFSHEILSAELNTILRHLDRLKEDSQIGSYEEVIIRTDKENICLIKLSREMFVLFVTETYEPTGHSVYEVKRLSPDFLKILS
jgi:predicted regulator of Ras-like GTPase activity (Roadblock/LC7/MglB family)